MSRKNYKFVQDHKYANFFERQKKFFLYPERKALYQYRKAQYYMHSKNLLMKAFWGIRWLHMRKKGYQLSLDAKIGKNFSLLHHGTRIIVGIASLGEHCTVGVNVVIGYAYNKETGRHEAPEIGDRVYVGHNATLVGKITVGNDVLIAPNAYVNTNIPSHSIVIGNNIIIPKTNASEKYLDLDNNN